MSYIKLRIRITVKLLCGKFFIAGLFLLFLLLTYQATAQNLTPGEYVSTNWNLDDGLPQSTVKNILQTHDGYIWLASYGGLVRFDGVKFTLFNRFNSLGMISDRILDFFEDKENRIWMKTEGGLVCFNRNGTSNKEVFKTYSLNDGLPNEEIHNIVEDDKGSIWVFTGLNKLYKMVNDRFIWQEISNDENLRQRALKGEGSSLHIFIKKILRFIDGKPVSYFDLDKYTNYLLWDVKQGPDGTLYVATSGDGIFIINPHEPDKIKKLTTLDGLISNSLRKILIDNTGYLWAVGWGGINRINLNGLNKIYKLYQQESKNKYVTSIIQDYEGNFWIGTETDGLTKLKKAIIRTYTAEHGLQKENLLSLFYKQNGTLLVATNCGGIYELWNGKIAYSPLNKFIKNNCDWSIFEDSHDRIWIGADRLTLIEGNKATLFSNQNGVNIFFVWAIYEDKNRIIWIGSSTGLFQYSNGKFLQYTVKEGLTANEVRSIFEDSKGNLWFGTVDGLNVMKEGKIKAYKLIPGARSNYIRAIYEDKEGTMWFGSYGGGLIRLKDNKFTVFTTGDGLFDNIVSHIVEDKYGYFWMGCNRGISRVSRNQLNEYANGKINSLSVTSYGKQDGMQSVETNGGFQPNAVTDKEGRIYFPTVQGLAVINPDDIQFKNYVPPVHIENFIVGGKEKPSALIPKAGVPNKIVNEFPFDSSDVQIEYTALSYADPKKVLFKYMLTGFDNGWIDAGTSRSVYYRRLPPGEYTFTVIAANNDGVWNRKGASVSFAIIPPFWMTWWFRGILILLFLSIGPAIYFNRISKLKKEQLLQQEFSRKLIESQDLERKRIAAELHDSLGQNLLIVKSKLTAGLNALQEEVKTKIAEAEEFVVNSIKEVRTISKNLSPHLLDQLGLTAAIEIMIENIQGSSGISFITKIENIDELVMEKMETNIYRIIQESLNNIIKHSGADTVHIDISKSNDKIDISIKDNGKGFDLNDENIQKGFGLAGIRERTRILNGELQINSQLYNGTELKIHIPVG